MSVIKIKSTHPESQGAYVLIEQEHFDPSVHKLYDPDQTDADLGVDDTAGRPSAGSGAAILPVSIDIPADWQSLHHNAKIGLAERLNGADDLVPADGETKTAAAERVIAAEVARRAAAQA